MYNLKYNIIWILKFKIQYISDRRIRIESWIYCISNCYFRFYYLKYKNYLYCSERKNLSYNLCIESKFKFQNNIQSNRIKKKRINCILILKKKRVMKWMGMLIWNKGHVHEKLLRKKRWKYMWRCQLKISRILFVLCIMILWMLFNHSTRYTHSYAPPMFCCMNNGLQLKNDLKRK